MNDVDGVIVGTPLAAGTGTAPPSAAELLAAFNAAPGPVAEADGVEAAASELAVQHRHQWYAEDRTRRDTEAVVVAENKRLIDLLNARRIEVVVEIDRWVARHVGQRPGATLHTETLGSVVDRLAIASVRAENLAEACRPEWRIARQQLHELAMAYDSLVSDVLRGTRRLPRWWPLKSYGGAP